MEILTIIRWIVFIALTALWLVIALANIWFGFRRGFFHKGPSVIPLIGSFAAAFAIWAWPIESSHIRQLSILIAIILADGIWIVFSIIEFIFVAKNKSEKP